MTKPNGYKTHADMRAEALELIAAYLANGGTITVLPPAEAKGL